jgi:hypothetical protein
LEILVEMAKHPETILRKFKDISLKKIKIKKNFSKPKKNGFVTNQTEIKNFIEELCGYVVS